MRECLQDRRYRDVKIFGTDIDPKAVAIARSGRYRKAASGLSTERLQRWFVETGADYRPVPEIRDMCVFSTHSLVKDPPFSKLDLISCRNVMIYLGEDLQDRLMRTFHYALQPGGCLFLGTAESVTRNSRLFTALDKKYRVLQRRDGGARLPVLQPQGVPALAPLPGLKLTAIRAAKILGTARPGETVTLHARVTGRMGHLIQAQATATVRGTLVLQCELTLAGTR